MNRAGRLVSVICGFALLPTPAAVAADSGPAAVTSARATEIPKCTLHVDAAAAGGNGTAEKPFKAIAVAVDAAEAGAVICVAEGAYSERLAVSDKPFTLAGGFQRGKLFKVRDSKAYPSKVRGKGGTFLRVGGDTAPTGDQLTAVDGFEISGYAQAIVREFWESQRFDVTNNYFHDNVCPDLALAGGAVSLSNVSGVIRGNVFAKNSCGRGGAIALNDAENKNTVTIEGNLFDANSGLEPDSAHGGAVYVFGNRLKIIRNTFTRNSVTQWGGGLYVGAYPEGGQHTKASLAWNVYRGNKAGNGGGGFFCDDGASCASEHEVYDGNCGSNILLDGGSSKAHPTIATFDRITNIRAFAPDCSAPGAGVRIDKMDQDKYSFKNSLFWANANERDFTISCDAGCKRSNVDVTYSMAQTKYAKSGVNITFGAGMVAPADPLFVGLDAGDLRLQDDSPAIGKGAGGVDLGAFGKGGGSQAPARGNPLPSSEASDPAASKPEAEADDRGPPAAGDMSAKDAFEAAKDLGTAEAWRAFLASYPRGFHADLARAYLKKLGASE